MCVIFNLFSLFLIEKAFSVHFADNRFFQQRWPFLLWQQLSLHLWMTTLLLYNLILILIYFNYYSFDKNVNKEITPWSNSVHEKQHHHRTFNWYWEFSWNSINYIPTHMLEERKKERDAWQDREKREIVAFFSFSRFSFNYCCFCSFSSYCLLLLL